MSNRDWYRKTSWSPEDREDFFTRFRRAREYNKSQYLRIQAIHLLDTGEKKEIAVALELIDLMIDKWPNPIELESAYYTKAQCLEAVGRPSDAIEAYRKSFEARRMKPNVRTDAPLGYAMFIIRNNRTDLYDEVVTILNELVSESDIIFHIDKYRYFTLFAYVADYYNQKDIAKKCAIRALQAAEQTHSGLSYHPTVGLVTEKDKKVIAKLKKISKK